MTGFLLDTNVPSETTKPLPDPKVRLWLDEVDDELTFFSVISMAELFKGIGNLPDGRRRAQLKHWIQSELRPWFGNRILPVTEPIAERFGLLVGKAKFGGVNLQMADGLIACTALEHDLTLVTRNVRDFSGFGVRLFNPWTY